MLHTDASAREGFTLLETLIAFLILSASLAVAIQSIAQTGDYAVRAQTNAALRSEARKLLAQLEPATKSAGKLDGVVDDRIEWSWIIEPYGTDEFSNLLRYTLTVRYVERPNASATFSGLVPLRDPRFD